MTEVCMGRVHLSHLQLSMSDMRRCAELSGEGSVAIWLSVWGLKLIKLRAWVPSQVGMYLGPVTAVECIPNPGQLSWKCMPLIRRTESHKSITEDEKKIARSTCHADRAEQHPRKAHGDQSWVGGSWRLSWLMTAKAGEQQCCFLVWMHSLPCGGLCWECLSQWVSLCGGMYML